MESIPTEWLAELVLKCYDKSVKMDIWKWEETISKGDVHSHSEFFHVGSMNLDKLAEWDNV